MKVIEPKLKASEEEYGSDKSSGSSNESRASLQLEDLQF
jgi:hypothetical protein